ncbi:MAG: excinuclease ABC subunit C [Saprospiraceae bacterium]|nr:excinuclease ABC subunit C [Saprospiraceae bacterium]
MTTEDYKAIMDTIPRSPGVYRFIDKEGVILYVGKAKVLRSRVSNYFGSKKGQMYRTRVMVKHADRLEFTIVDSEADALLLENTLIKKYQPRYNVQLKDGKSYSYIVIRNERYPRVYITRKIYKDGSTYFGPYTSKARLKIILDLIKKLFPLRTCKFNLSEENIAAGKFKVCLEYHINNCKGACEGHEPEEEYNQKIVQIKNLLRGNFAGVKRHFKSQMQEYAENLEYEKALDLKTRLEAFQDYQGRSTVVSTSIQDLDVFSIAVEEKYAFVNFLKVVNGALINTFTLEMEINLDDDPEKLLSFAIPHLREKFNSISLEILTPFPVKLEDQNVKVTVPQRGEKKKLLDLSEKNVTFFKLHKRKEAANKTNKQTSAERILRTLQNDLNMEEVPLHIECFDNSNIQGSHPVASCVVFKNAKPSKKDYRHFNIKTVEGPDDFASMEEVVFRRYRRLLDEDQSLPQLVVIDGGKGQLSSAMKSIRNLDLEKKITVIGIAKKLEEIFFAEDPIPLYINKKSEGLKLIQQARNEAHRFAIDFHRNKRSQNFTGTELTKIPGIGKKTAEKMLKAFKSVKKIKAASQEELEQVVGKINAQKVSEYFKENP